MVAKFEVFKNKSGKYRWRLRQEGGNMIAYSGEGHVIKANTVNGIESLKKEIGAASIKDLTPSPSADIVTPAPPPAATIAEPATLQPAVAPEPTSNFPLTMEKVNPLSLWEEKDFPILAIVLLAVVWYVVGMTVILA